MKYANETDAEIVSESYRRRKAQTKPRVAKLLPVVEYKPQLKPRTPEQALMQTIGEEIRELTRAIEKNPGAALNTFLRLVTPAGPGPKPRPRKLQR